MKYLNRLSTQIHENAVNHGWWKDKPTIEHNLMLVLTEVSEMVEAHRNQRWTRWNAIKQRGELQTGNEDVKQLIALENPDGFNERFTTLVKDTVEDEMADVFIRLLDLAGSLGMDFEKLSECRYHRSFEHFSFTENAFALCKGLVRENINIFKRIQFGISFVQHWAKSENVMLHFHVRAKMQFNVSRPYQHGGKLY
jgi:NTP pyrophosphatase (non-canonical NTP hydrolase)